MTFYLLIHVRKLSVTCNTWISTGFGYQGTRVMLHVADYSLDSLDTGKLMDYAVELTQTRNKYKQIRVYP